ncbi:MAG: hypothetical protein JNJ45_11120 [Chthonomonas sp.]|nr:hypothetical protein [Chthonomonas sp.]
MRRFDLIENLGYQVHVVDAVIDEILTERDTLHRLIDDGKISTLSLEGVTLSDTVAALLSLGLGNGEAFCFAAAVKLGASLAIDDRRAIKRAQPVAPDVNIVTSCDIVVANIRANQLTIAGADAIKTEWAEHHQFRLKFASFTDLV